MGQHCADRDGFFACALQHVRVTPFDAAVIYRTEDERENYAYVNRRQRPVYILESYRYAVFAYPVVKDYQQRPAYQDQKRGFRVWAFLEFFEHSFLTSGPSFSLFILSHRAPAGRHYHTSLHVCPASYGRITPFILGLFFLYTLRTTAPGLPQPQAAVGPALPSMVMM